MSELSGEFEGPGGFESPVESGLRRLFFALWPSDDLREQLERDTRNVARDSGGRIIPARNFHVTVAFVGEVLHSDVQAVIAAGAATSSAAFTLTLDRVDTLPGSDILVLAGSNVPAELVALVEGLRFNLSNNQIRLKRKIFRPHITPHITLARNLPRRRPVQKIEAVEWPVEEFVLIDSTVTRSGSEYQVLKRWPLA